MGQVQENISIGSCVSAFAKNASWFDVRRYVGSLQAKQLVAGSQISWVALFLPYRWHVFMVALLLQTVSTFVADGRRRGRSQTGAVKLDKYESAQVYRGAPHSTNCTASASHRERGMQQQDVSNDNFCAHAFLRRMAYPPISLSSFPSQHHERQESLSRQRKAVFISLHALTLSAVHSCTAVHCPPT